MRSHNLRAIGGVRNIGLVFSGAARWLTGTFFVSMLVIGLISPSSASREILSDMDCIVEPSAIVEIGSAVPGLLAVTNYDRADYVSAGSIMAQLESGVERVSVEIAESVAQNTTAVELRQLTAEFGQRTQRRNADLLKTKSISKQSMDQLSTEAHIASLQVRQELEGRDLALLEVTRAKSVLDRRVIRSPFEGTVMQRYKSAGEYVDSEPVFRLAQLDPLHVEVIVPIEYLNSLKTGLHAGVTIAAPGFEGKVLDAMVRRIDAVADAASATYGVRLILDNPELKIPSGVRCVVDFFSS